MKILFALISILFFIVICKGLSLNLENYANITYSVQENGAETSLGSSQTDLCYIKNENQI